MNVKGIAAVALAALLAAGSLGGAAYAAGGHREEDGRDAAALAAMKVSLSQAIATAEASGGRAVGADIVREHGTHAIEVEIVGARGVTTVVVDGQSGQVIATHDGERDDGDDD